MSRSLGEAHDWRVLDATQADAVTGPPSPCWACEGEHDTAQRWRHDRACLLADKTARKAAMALMATHSNGDHEAALAAHQAEVLAWWAANRRATPPW